MGDLRGFTRDLMRQMEPGQSGARQKMTLAVNAKRWCPETGRFSKKNRAAIEHETGNY
jgi:hypothetical protein